MKDCGKLYKDRVMDEITKRWHHALTRLNSTGTVARVSELGDRTYLLTINRHHLFGDLQILMTTSSCTPPEKITVYHKGNLIKVLESCITFQEIAEQAIFHEFDKLSDRIENGSPYNVINGCKIYSAVISGECGVTSCLYMVKNKSGNYSYYINSRGRRVYIFKSLDEVTQLTIN